MECRLATPAASSHSIGEVAATVSSLVDVASIGSVLGFAAATLCDYVRDCRCSARLDRSKHYFANGRRLLLEHPRELVILS